MKKIKILCLSLFVTIANISLSQEYIPIVESGNYFSVGGSCGGGPQIIEDTHYEIIGGDSIIGNQTYKKLYRSESNVEYYPLINKQLIGFLRETDDRKVYARNIHGHEGLIYDYYVEKGDTLNFLNPFLSGWLYEEYHAFTDELSDTLAVVDSVYFAEINGVSRKHYVLNAYGNVWPVPMLYIEGVGGLRGFFFCGGDCLHRTGGPDYLLCAYKNDNLYYQNPDYNFCFVTKTEDIDIEEIQIFPNPATDILHFNQAQTYEILDIQGRVLKKSEAEQNSANISELKNGMYFIKIENKLFKFIKN